jgi:hypothetical protein
LAIMLRHVLGMLSVWSSFVGCLPLPGTEEEPEKLEDGAECTEKSECRSNNCTRDGLCAASWCECSGDTCAANGEHSADCSPEALCIGSENVVETIGQFFSGENDNDGYCQLPCSAGCPEHFECGGDFCRPIPGWADPVPSVSWSGAAEGSLSGSAAEEKVPLEPGQVVTLTGSGMSPVGSKIESFAWTLVTDDGARAESSGATLDVTLDADDSYRRAELRIADAKLRGAVIYVIFEAAAP